MTNEEFLNFDTSIFYSTGYEAERQYLSSITAYFIFSMTDTELNYQKAVEEGRVQTPNKYLDWFNEPGLTLRELKKKDYFLEINPDHKETKEFIDKYETLCRKFLLAYEKQYNEICAPETMEAFYTIKECRDLILSITDKRSAYRDKGSDLTMSNLVAAGFVDFRLPCVFSFENESERKLTPHQYGEGMIPLADSFRTTKIHYLKALTENASKLNFDRTKA